MARKKRSNLMVDPIGELQDLLAGGTPDEVPARVERLVRDRLWEDRVDYENKSFRSLDSFITTPQPRGLGTSPAVLLAFCLPKPAIRQLLLSSLGTPLKQHGGDRRSTVFRIDAINLKNQGGTSASYRLKRLQKRDPKLAQAVARGEFTMKQAEALAGVGPKPKTSFELLKAAWMKADQEGRDAFVAWLRSALVLKPEPAPAQPLHRVRLDPDDYQKLMAQIDDLADPPTTTTH